MYLREFGNDTFLRYFVGRYTTRHLAFHGSFLWFLVVVEVELGLLFLVLVLHHEPLRSVRYNVDTLDSGDYLLLVVGIRAVEAGVRFGQGTSPF